MVSGAGPGWERAWRAGMGEMGAVDWQGRAGVASERAGSAGPGRLEDVRVPT